MDAIEQRHAFIMTLTCRVLQLKQLLE